MEELKPDVLVVATGAAPLVPDNIPGIDREGVHTAWDVLKGEAALKPRNVVIVGGGSVGCETADFLAELGDNLAMGRTTVTIVEMLRRIAMDMALETRHLLMGRLREKAVTIITAAKVKEIRDEGVVISRNGSDETLPNVDHIILALGSGPVEELSEKLRGKVGEIHVIGDAQKPRRAVEAIAEGRKIGMKI
ncbi:FAD-dependent oxidoreductase [Thermodesulfobacteriota bacterium]